MKLKNKAMVPIGVIVLVIIVIIAGFGIWWFLSRDQWTVNKGARAGYSDAWFINDDEYPFIAHTPADKWAAGYVQATTGESVIRCCYSTLSVLKGNIHNYGDTSDVDDDKFDFIIKYLESKGW